MNIQNKFKRSAIIVGIATTSFLAFKGNSQNVKKSIDYTKNELIENNLDNIHKQIIHRNIQDIFKEYGEKEGILLINKHLLIEMNKIRKKHGSPELIGYDEVLVESSKQRADSLTKQQDFYHGDAENAVSARFYRLGLDRFGTCGENLAKGHKTIEEVISHWMRSPGHKKNILKPTYKKSGLYIIDDLWVLNRIG